MTLTGLVSAGIIIGVAGSSYFSNENSSLKPSSVSLSNDPLVTGTKTQNNSMSRSAKQGHDSRQSNPFDVNYTPPATERDTEGDLLGPDTQAVLTASESASYTDSQASYLERPEQLIKPDTTESSLLVFGDVGSLTWEPSSFTDYESIQIQLSGPDNITIKKDFYSGEVASITESLPDGYYNWQSITTPTIDPYVRQQMTAVRESGDLVAETELKQRFRDEGSLLTREQAKNNLQSGGFRVANGQILDGSIRE